MKCFRDFAQNNHFEVVKIAKSKVKVCPNLTLAEGQVFGIGCKIFTIAGVSDFVWDIEQLGVGSDLLGRESDGSFLKMK